MVRKYGLSWKGLRNKAYDILSRACEVVCEPCCIVCSKLCCTTMNACDTSACQVVSVVGGAIVNVATYMLGSLIGASARRDIVQKGYEVDDGFAIEEEIAIEARDTYKKMAMPPLIIGTIGICMVWCCTKNINNSRKWRYNTDRYLDPMEIHGLIWSITVVISSVSMVLGEFIGMRKDLEDVEDSAMSIAVGASVLASLTICCALITNRVNASYAKRFQEEA